MRKLRLILLIPLAIFMLVWVGSIIRFEMLTSTHGHNFNELYRENTMIGEVGFFRVLYYSDSFARVYFVSGNRSAGDILTFSNENGQWVYNSWERTVWSTTGSADDFIWPYWHHSIEGRATFLILILPTYLVLCSAVVLIAKKRGKNR